jgi:uncharacterized protein (TIGR02145 family)
MRTQFINKGQGKPAPTYGRGHLALFTVTLALALAFTLSGCGNDVGDDDDDDNPLISSHSDTNTDSYTDKGNDISSYKTKKIDTQTWMAENLNYKVAGSLCYGEGSSNYSASEVQANCDKYGRLYDWATAMALPSSCNSTDCSGQVSAKHRGICPSGWHIPNNEDWDKLFRYVDGNTDTNSPYSSSTAGKYLKSTNGWKDYKEKSGNGEDEFGFSALPSGYGYSDGYFYSAGSDGFWWSASERSSNYAYYWYMPYDDEYVHCNGRDESSLFSVRCVQD